MTALAAGFLFGVGFSLGVLAISEVGFIVLDACARLSVAVFKR